MVKSKNSLFEPGIQECAEFYKALSHPARIAILRYLAETKTCITGNISDVLPLSRSTVNQHLHELKRTGLIQGHTEGVNTKYCLDPDVVKRLKTISGEFLGQLDLGVDLNCKQDNR